MSTPDFDDTQSDANQMFDFLDEDAANTPARKRRGRSRKGLVMPIIRKPVPISESGPARVGQIPEPGAFDGDFEFLDDTPTPVKNRSTHLDNDSMEGVHYDRSEKNGSVLKNVLYLVIGAVVIGIAIAAYSLFFMQGPADQADNSVTNNDPVIETAVAGNATLDVNEADSDGTTIKPLSQQFFEQLQEIEIMIAQGNLDAADQAITSMDRSVYGYGAPEFGELEQQITRLRDGMSETVAEAEQKAEAARSIEANRVAEEAELVAAEQAAEAAQLAIAERAAEADRLATAERVAEAAQLATAERAAEAARLAEAQQLESERAAEALRAADDARLAEAELAAEASKLAEAERAAEAARLAEAQLAAEAARLAEASRAADAARRAESEATRIAEAEQVAVAARQAEQEANRLAVAEQQRAAAIEAERVAQAAATAIAAQQKAAADESLALATAKAEERRERDRIAKLETDRRIAERAKLNEERTKAAEFAAQQAQALEAEKQIALDAQAQLQITPTQENYAITDEDFNFIGGKFVELKTAIENRDIAKVIALTQRSGKRVQQMLQIFENHTAVTARIDNVASRNAEGVIVGQLRIQKLVKRSGAEIDAPSNLSSITLRSERGPAGWSTIAW